MIEIKVQNGESIDKALKRFKRKFEQTKVAQQLRENMHFIKPSVKKRKQKIKAKYIQRIRTSDDI